MRTRHLKVWFYAVLMAGVLSAPAMLFSMGKRPSGEPPALEEQARETKSYREMTEEAPRVDARDTQTAAGVIAVEEKKA